MAMDEEALEFLRYRTRYIRNACLVGVSFPALMRWENERLAKQPVALPQYIGEEE